PEQLGWEVSDQQRGPAMMQEQMSAEREQWQQLFAGKSQLASRVEAILTPVLEAQVSAPSQAQPSELRSNGTALCGCPCPRATESRALSARAGHSPHSHHRLRSALEHQATGKQEGEMAASHPWKAPPIQSILPC